MLQHFSDAQDERPICLLLKNVGDGARRDLMAQISQRSRYSSLAPPLLSAATPSRMKVIRLPLGTMSAFSGGPENVRVLQKNQPPTAETTSGSVVSSRSVNILPQVLNSQGHFFT
jgi:hypothetical protein